MELGCWFWRFLLRYVGNLISYLKLLSILLLISGQNPFPLLGYDTPAFWTWTQNNKVPEPLIAVTMTTDVASGCCGNRLTPCASRLSDLLVSDGVLRLQYDGDTLPVYGSLRGHSEWWVLIGPELSAALDWLKCSLLYDLRMLNI